MKTCLSLNTAKTVAIATLIALTLACGYSAKSTMPPVAGNVPAISALAPNSATAGAAAFTMTVNGSSFNSKATVNFNGAALTSTFVTANQLTATVPATAIATSGTAQVTVTNPGTSGGIYGGGTSPETSTPMSFTIN
jgi:hypothetical protein